MTSLTKKILTYSAGAVIAYVGVCSAIQSVKLNKAFTPVKNDYFEVNQIYWDDDNANGRNPQCRRNYDGNLDSLQTIMQEYLKDNHCITGRLYNANGNAFYIWIGKLGLTPNIEIDVSAIERNEKNRLPILLTKQIMEK